MWQARDCEAHPSQLVVRRTIARNQVQPDAATFPGRSLSAIHADERPRVLHRLTGLLHDDVRDEEDQLLPRIQDRLSPTQVRLLGAAWEVVRRTAPTRPHPVVARRPPGNVLAALPLSIIDRLRDRVDAAAGRRPGPRPRLAAVSRRLTGVAHRVERWAPFRRGEDPRTARD